MDKPIKRERAIGDGLYIPDHRAREPEAGAQGQTQRPVAAMGRSVQRGYGAAGVAGFASVAGTQPGKCIRTRLAASLHVTHPERKQR
jgi:hypothetical protein